MRDLHVQKYNACRKGVRIAGKGAAAQLYSRINSQFTPVPRHVNVWRKSLFSIGYARLTSVRTSNIFFPSRMDKVGHRIFFFSSMWNIARVRTRDQGHMHALANRSARTPDTIEWSSFFLLFASLGIAFTREYAAWLNYNSPHPRLALFRVPRCY